MPPHPDTDQGLDMERKTELIMEKKLRACRVNILPRNGGYFKEPYIPPPANKRTQAPPPIPASVEKATNPIALRYWNQCMDKTPERQVQDMSHEKESQSSISTQMPPWVSSGSYNVNTQTAVQPKSLNPKLNVKVPDITKRVRSESVPRGVQYSRLNISSEIIHHDDPSPVLERRQINEKVEVVKVLSTAGTGINRNNEVKEALGNINRFFTVDKIKREDAARVVDNNTTLKQESLISKPIIVETKPYKQIKEDQIKVSNERANFQNNSINRIPKSPQPFRGVKRDLTTQGPTKKEEHCQCKHDKSNNIKINMDTDMNQFIDNLIPQLNQIQKTQLGLAIFNQLPPDIVKDLMAQQIALMSGDNMFSMLTRASNEVLDKAVPMLFPRTSDDVKLKLVVGSLPKLAPHLKNEMLQETDTELLPVLKAKKECSQKQEQDKNYKLKEETNVGTRQEYKINIPEIRIDKTLMQIDNTEVTDVSMDEVKNIGDAYTHDDNNINVPNKPKIIIDLTNSNVAFESPEYDAAKEWDWEDGEELEYEFYEQDLHRPVGTSI